MENEELIESLRLQIKTVNEYAEKKEKRLDKAISMLERCMKYHKHSVEAEDELRRFLDGE